MIFDLFEKRIPPYPSNEPTLPPKGFFAFLWACTRGMRGWISLLTLTSALLSVYEAFLFAVMSRIVDWLSTTPAAQLWQVHHGSLTGTAAPGAASCLFHRCSTGTAAGSLRSITLSAAM